MNRTLFLAHRWLGLLLCGYLALVASTGAVLVWQHELDAALNRDWLVAAAPSRAAEAAPVTPDEALAAGRAALRAPRDCMVGYPEEASGVYTIYCDALDAAGALRAYAVFVDPSDGRVTGARDRDRAALDRRHLVPTLLHVHATLLLGEVGYLVVGTLGLLLALGLATGAYVWWPRGRGQWRAALTIKRPAGLRRRLLDLHRVFGAYGFVVLVLVVVSGLYLAWWDYARPAIDSFAPLAQIPEPAAASGSADVGAARAVAAAVARVPGLAPNLVWIPDPHEDRYTVFLGSARDSVTGETIVQVGRGSAEALWVRDGRALATQDHVLDFLTYVHGGNGLGLPGRWLVFLAGVCMVVLAVTGPWLWLRARRMRRTTVD